MSRLRHPIRAAREPFGKAGLIVAIVALVAAIGGTAFAASGLNSKQKKEVTSIAKKYAGKPGAPGINGTNGTNGAAGAKGDTGAAGSNGTNGESVKVTESANAIEGKCTGTTPATGKGGAKFEVGASKAYACNGHEGSPWTAGGTLPSGKTETGVWAAGLRAGTATGSFFVPISFNIPLAAPLSDVEECGEPGEPVCKAHFIHKNEPAPAGCTGGTAAAPTAEPGNLCVYAGGEEDIELVFIVNPEGEKVGAATTGALIALYLEEKATDYAYGSWAVTAP